MVDITGFNLPLTSITWMEDGQVLMNNTNDIIITHGSFAAPPTTSTLVRGSIQSRAPMDNNTYQVVVVNPAGQDTSTFTITVNGEQVAFNIQKNRKCPRNYDSVNSCDHYECGSSHLVKIHLG